MRTTPEQRHDPVCLVVLDGWGYRQDTTDNAIAAARTPHFDGLWSQFPHTLLEASGRAVGLPDGQMGNSEVGHTTIGAGTAVNSDLLRITDAINQDEFEANPVFDSIFRTVRERGSTLHVLGLLGAGGVHAHSDHMLAVLTAAKRAGVTDIAVHAFTDGRDSGIHEAATHVGKLEQHLGQLGVGTIASLSGRYFAMDRDENYDRLAKAEAAILRGEGIRADATESAQTILRRAYQAGMSDEMLEPHVFADEQGRFKRISAQDGVIFMNFRADRAIQLTDLIAKQPGISLATLTEYAPAIPAQVAFAPVDIRATLAGAIAEAGLTQSHVAESEKGPHATYFLNGKRRPPHALEKHVILPSYNSEHDGIDTHDQQPDMRAAEVTEAAIAALEAGDSFVFVNLANPDMVGHTGNVPAIIQAVETVDRQLALLRRTVLSRGGVLLVTADHGNAELNRTVSGEIHTAHTTNLVPFIAVGENGYFSLRPDGTLADIAPTVLSLLGIQKPTAMTGMSLKHRTL